MAVFHAVYYQSKRDAVPARIHSLPGITGAARPKSYTSHIPPRAYRDSHNRDTYTRRSHFLLYASADEARYLEISHSMSLGWGRWYRACGRRGWQARSRAHDWLWPCCCGVVRRQRRASGTRAVSRCAAVQAPWTSRAVTWLPAIIVVVTRES